MIIETLGNIKFQGSDNQSILESALDAGHFLEYSCKNGQCGACKTTLMQGKVVELQPQIGLSEQDRVNRKILTCCCAPRTDIQIDAEDLMALQGIEVKTLPARISRIELYHGHLAEVELRLPPTAKFSFLEGQFIDVIGPQGVRRSYSVANSSKEKYIVLFIKRVKNGVLSNYWFNEARVDDLLRIEGPKGTFFLREHRKKLFFLATGTGIAPVKSILDKLSESTGVVGNLNISLYWGNRHAEDFFWHPEYSAFKLNYIPIVSRARDGWLGKVGYVQDVASEDKLDIENTHVYACGSMEMISSAKTLFTKMGLNESRFYSDAFVSS